MKPVLNKWWIVWWLDEWETECIKCEKNSDAHLIQSVFTHPVFKFLSKMLFYLSLKWYPLYLFTSHTDGFWESWYIIAVSLWHKFCSILWYPGSCHLRRPLYCMGHSTRKTQNKGCYQTVMISTRQDKSKSPCTIWVRSRNCGSLVTWFCYQLIAKPGHKTAAVLWPDPYSLSTSTLHYYYLIQYRHPEAT